MFISETDSPLFPKDVKSFLSVIEMLFLLMEESSGPPAVHKHLYSVTGGKPGGLFIQ